ARPGVDRLLVVADGENVPMLMPDIADHRVLHRIEILELVDEHAVPSRAYSRHDMPVLQQLRRLEEQHVEVEHPPLLEEMLVLLEDAGVVVIAERLVAETLRREAHEQRTVSTHRDAESSEDGALIAVVGDAEARLEPDALAEFAQQLGTEGVDRSRLHRQSPCANGALEPERDLVGCLVGEGESAEPIGLEPARLHEMTNALDEAERLPGTRSGEDQ